jgi:hypothetical protein
VALLQDVVACLRKWCSFAGGCGGFALGCGGFV